jgi:hypothetical protein
MTGRYGFMFFVLTLRAVDFRLARGEKDSGSGIHSKYGAAADEIQQLRGHASGCKPPEMRIHRQPDTSSNIRVYQQL